MEKVILVGVEQKRRSTLDAHARVGRDPRTGRAEPISRSANVRPPRHREAAESLDELGKLAETAGGVVAGTLIQRLERFHPATLIGPGKVQELTALVSASGVRTVIFDEDLSPAQQRNLEKAVQANILDRTRLILDIFAQRARTREGKLQVELAQLTYLLPRLTGRGTQFSQQVGGIGTRRGPGERQLEYERRHIRDHIAQLQHEIDRIRGERELQRAGRLSVPVPIVALVGYTNTGKSTLTNALSGARSEERIYADDKLFATLDPTTRRVRLPSGGRALVTDTVGFIQKLPHALVASFRATLEEILHADCLIHVVDAASDKCRFQRDAVLEVIRELGAGDIPLLTALNKVDCLTPAERRSHRVSFPDAVFISAITGEGLDALMRTVEDVLCGKWLERELVLGHKDMNRLPDIYRCAQIVARRPHGDGLTLVLRVTAENWKRLTKILSQTAKT